MLWLKMFGFTAIKNCTAKTNNFIDMFKYLVVQTVKMSKSYTFVDIFTSVWQCETVVYFQRLVSHQNSANVYCHP